MPVALLDTNVLFASVSARDDYHNRAQEIVRGIDHGDLPDVIPNRLAVHECSNGSKQQPSVTTIHGVIEVFSTSCIGE
nr:hypothetical protein [Halobellus clavatus]